MLLDSIMQKGVWRHGIYMVLFFCSVKLYSIFSNSTQRRETVETVSLESEMHRCIGCAHITQCRLCNLPHSPCVPPFIERTPQMWNVIVRIPSTSKISDDKSRTPASQLRHTEEHVNNNESFLLLFVELERHSEVFGSCEWIPHRSARCHYRSLDFLNFYLAINDALMDERHNTTRKNWTWTAIVRDPLDRVVSGFTDKCVR